jgi:uncharacterized protein YjbI with pentapeptide repeats
VGQHPGQPLDLSSSDPAAGATLTGADLSRADLREARLRGASLRSSNLEGAVLKGADLRGAKLGAARMERADLEEANLQNADLITAGLRGAVLSGANLKGALLEDADLREANLRFASLPDAICENAKMAGADLWGAKLPAAVLAGADLKGSVFTEAAGEGADFTGADLRGAAMAKSNFARGKFAGADFRGANVAGINLREAVLRDAKLQELDLSGSDLTAAHFSGAALDRTRMRRGQIGEAVGEELAGDWEGAAQAYLALERNFAALDDAGAASWAYRRRRRMEKRTALKLARLRHDQGHLRAALPYYAKAGRFQLVEWLCDYGESPSRVLLSLLAVYLLFFAAYLALGGVRDVGSFRVSRNPLDVASFTLTAMTGRMSTRLVPSHAYVETLMSLQSLLGIALTGLLGFVIGNRIRR